jgi:hypothetical protein
MKIKIALDSALIILFLLFASCTPSETAIQQAIRETEASGEIFKNALNTAIAETQLAIPTNSPTPTNTPTSTPKPTEPGTIDMDWEFDQEGNFGGWGANYYDTDLIDLSVAGGYFTGTSPEGGGALLYNRNLRLDGDKIDIIEIAMRVSKSGTAALYFGTEEDPQLNEWKKWTFRVQSSEDMIVYTIRASKHIAWRGIITELRLDPIDVADTLIEIDYIRLISSNED